MPKTKTEQENINQCDEKEPAAALTPIPDDDGDTYFWRYKFENRYKGQGVEIVIDDTIVVCICIEEDHIVKNDETLRLNRGVVFRVFHVAGEESFDEWTIPIADVIKDTLAQKVCEAKFWSDEHDESEKKNRTLEDTIKKMTTQHQKEINDLRAQHQKEIENLTRAMEQKIEQSVNDLEVRIVAQTLNVVERYWPVTKRPVSKKKITKTNKITRRK